MPKTAFAEVKFRRGTVRVAGFTKGSGMIQPQMATTLGFVMTDSNLPLPALRTMLKRAVERSYNRISVDGDTSTNDTLLLMANGASGVRPDPKEMPKMEAAIAEVMESLAQAIARDGEGASKLITILVSGAANDAAAARLARSIANSPLVKTAVAGCDANWGRILSAAGNAGVDFDPAKADISLQGVPVCRGGLAAPFDEPELKSKLAAKDCEIRLTLRGKGKVRLASGPATSPRSIFESTPAIGPSRVVKSQMGRRSTPMNADKLSAFNRRLSAAGPLPHGRGSDRSRARQQALWI